MTTKITKKELKQPDAFRIVLERVLTFAIENKKMISWVVGVVILVLLVFAVLYLYQSSRQNDAWKLYINAQLSDMKNKRSGDIIDQNSMKAYQDIASRYPSTRAALMSNYHLGNLYYQIQDFDKSIKAYQAFLREDSGDSELRTLVYIGLGYCYEAKSDFKNAMESFEKAEKTKSAIFFGSINDRNIARMHEKLHNKVKAIEYYQKALKETSDPSIQQIIKRKISSLG